MIFAMKSLFATGSCELSSPDLVTPEPKTNLPFTTLISWSPKEAKFGGSAG
jgi:hypothetical protein